MAWTAPMTAVANTAFTAAQFNTFVRDNLNETAPAKATVAGSMFVGAGANSIVERYPTTDVLNTNQTTESTTYTDLLSVGPSVSVVTGSSAMVFIQCRVRNTTTTNTAFAGYTVSGATSISVTDNSTVSALGVTLAGGNYGCMFLHNAATDPLTPGTNTFTMKYRVTGGEGEYSRRRITVVPL